MRALLPLLLLLSVGACDEQVRSDSGPAAGRSPCEPIHFEGDRFTVCTERGGDIEIVTSDSAGRPYRSFAALQAALGDRSAAVAFAMNAGMYDEDGHAIGLLIERGKQLHRINRRDGGGNFHLKPNGVFLVRKDGRAEVVSAERFRSSPDIAFATQSGPMLVVDGKLHPAFEVDGRSRHIRNGVGVGPDGPALFAISEEPVSFGKFARLFRDRLKTRNALFFDGAVSSLWDPGNARRDTRTDLGPLVVVFRREESGPGHEGRARP